MKKSLFLFLAYCFSFSVVAQNLRLCATDEKVQEVFLKHPEKKEIFERLREDIKQRRRNGQEKLKASTVYTIPVVFHILHVGGTENISDAQIQSAMNILNQDFRKLNPDITQIQPSFVGIAADVQMEFRLATKDPNGNCTNGIIRHYDPETLSWDGFPSEYLYTWPPHRYMNVYVVKNINFNAAGYTFFPGTSPTVDMDAIVMLSDYVGNIGTSNPFKSRVLTHEVGHWLNLPHVWGFNNNPGVVCGDDGILDTPYTMGWTTCNLTNNDVCSPGVNENVENYMEYAYCSKMFTQDQATEMQLCLTSPVANRWNLFTATNLAQTGVLNPMGLCAPAITLHASPTYSTCAGGTLAVVCFTNNGAPSNYSWSVSGNGTVLTQGQPTTTLMFPSPGTYTVQCVASNTSGSSQATTAVYAIQPTVIFASGMMESFENTSLPAGWSLPGNTNPSLAWKQTNVAATHGMQSIYIQGEVMPPGKKEILQTPAYNFLNNPGASYTFKYAYACKTSTSTDRLRIFGSKDCGGSWKLIYSGTASFLCSGSGGLNSNIFIPNASQWKLYQLDAHPNFYEFLFYPQVIFRFEFTEDSLSGFGNRFYLDEINFSTPSGIMKNEYVNFVHVYPNPAENEINIELSLNNEEEFLVVKLLDINGRFLREEKIQMSGGTEEKTFIFSLQGINPGMYMLEITGKKARWVQKVAKY